MTPELAASARSQSRKIDWLDVNGDKLLTTLHLKRNRGTDAATFNGTDPVSYTHLRAHET